MSGALSLPPTAFREADVARIVKAYIASGERDPAMIASNTAHRLFASRRCAVFPPAPGAPLSVRTAWDQLVGYVDHAFREGGIAVGDVQAADNGVNWGVVSTAEGSIDLERYPWQDAVVHDSGSPTPGTFWTARPFEDDGSLVRDFVFSGLAMAGADTRLAFDDSKVGRRLRREARELILASPFNDLRVTSQAPSLAGGRAPGTRGPNDQGVTYMMGRNGRGLVWAKRHYDDLIRLANGRPAKRGIDLGGNVVGSGRSCLLLYLPALNLLALRGPMPALTTEGVAWKQNGKNAIHPPPPVDELGVDTSGVEVGR